MDRRTKPKKEKAEARRPLARKSPKGPVGKANDLEKRLAEALEREADALKLKAEALEQQTATAEILRVISNSPTDIQPVFDAVAESAARLCKAQDASIFRREGDRLLFAAHHGPIPFGRVGDNSIPLVRETLNGRCVLEAQTMHVADLQTEVDEFPQSSELARRWGYRTVLSVPLIRDGAAIGSISLRRTEARSFGAPQIALLQTFADQAVIAIENVRLFTELEARNRDLTATSEILRVISRSPTDAQPVFDTIAERAMRLCDAAVGFVAMFDGALIHVGALANISPEGVDAIHQAFPAPPSRGSAGGRVILTGDVVQIPDAMEDPEYQLTGAAQAVRFRGILGVPMLHQGRAIGVISVGRPKPGMFSEEQVQVLKTFADQAVIAIENVRLFNETRAALERQTATAEVLKVISRSAFDLQPVLDTLIENATRLCGARRGAIMRRDGDLYHGVAFYNAAPDLIDFIKGHPVAPGRHSITARVALERRTIHVADLQADPEYRYALQDAAPIRTELGVPMFRGDDVLGVIILYKLEVQPFTDKQIELVETFADQAVIAIENVRLFRELETANRGLAAASQHKSEFLANMSHELRTPLNAIIGYSELLEEEAGDLDGGRLVPDLQKIATAAKHQLSLINDILDLSKVEAGRMELELADFNLPSAIDNALTLMRERATRRGVTLGWAIDDRVRVIQGDERKVKQVLLNLLSNALKFTPEGGRIDVRAAVSDGLLEVSVTDTGVGIAPEDQEAVFEEFRQVGTADKKVEGTGLGLALSRKFIELHGGRIWVKSELGHGSTFTFTLPVRRED